MVGHGQMGERQLETVMESFLRGDFDVLCATTIIEAGLDIPSANTLIVERADLLGLSQLYQIRGRVGRSDVPAHAYLFYPDAAELTEEAGARLAALADYTELGSGFKIAMRDLELRGAGNLLGDEQTGHVAAIGFELYCELLAEAVADLQGQAPPAVASAVRVDAAVDAYVPSTYVGMEAAKMDVHRRIALAALRGRPPRAGERARRPVRPDSGAGREPDRHPGRPNRTCPARCRGTLRAPRPGRAVRPHPRCRRYPRAAIGDPGPPVSGRQTRTLPACSGIPNRNGGGSESGRWYIRSTQ